LSIGRTKIGSYVRSNKDRCPATSASSWMETASARVKAASLRQCRPAMARKRPALIWRKSAHKRTMGIPC